MIVGATAGVDLGRVLLDLLIVVVAARAAAELAERIGIPGVLGEIGAGLLIGPSALNLVTPHGDRGTAIAVLAELGVLLLLLAVGLETDVGELARVGGPALAVGVAGVAIPFVTGAAVAHAVWGDMPTAVFVGAALTATSVGITARVFGDLRALASIEARIVLGAAVADDVIGLVILTVVTKVVTTGSVDAATVLSTIGLAALFLAGTGVVGLLGAPRLFAVLGRRATSPATTAVAGFAVMLGFAVLADQAKLAFIIGAFMAGMALGRTEHHQRISADLGAVGHLLIPVFFVTIGLNTDLGSLGSGPVLGAAAALAGVATVGKILSGWAAYGRAADKLLIGIGMIPRGEVGLIFAAIGLSGGVLDAEQYGALVLVVLVTTVITPPLLRRRLQRGVQTPPPVATEARSAELIATALAAAAQIRRKPPEESVLELFASQRLVPLQWQTRDTPALVELLRADQPRSWRLLEVTGVLERALPEVAAFIDHRRADMTDLDPLGSLRFPVVSRLHRLATDEPELAHHRITNELLIAALLIDVTDEESTQRSLVHRLLDGSAAAATMTLVSDAELLRRQASIETGGFDPNELAHLAAHLGGPAHARQAYLLAVSTVERGSLQRLRLDALHELLSDALARPELSGELAPDVVEQRLAAAGALLSDAHVIERLRHTPLAHVVANEPADLARHAELIEPLPARGTVRLSVQGGDQPGQWVIEVACRDTPGLLARIADVLLEFGLELRSADIATWPDGGVVDRFDVRSPTLPSNEALSTAIRRQLRARLYPVALRGVTLTFDHRALPWHTLCLAEGPAHIGAFRAVTHALATAGVGVHAARVAVEEGQFRFRFWLADRAGRKLDQGGEARIRTRLQQLETQRPSP